MYGVFAPPAVSRVLPLLFQGKTINMKYDVLSCGGACMREVDPLMLLLFISCRRPVCSVGTSSRSRLDFKLDHEASNTIYPHIVHCWASWKGS